MQSSGHLLLRNLQAAQRLWLDILGSVKSKKRYFLKSCGNPEMGSLGFCDFVNLTEDSVLTHQDLFFIYKGKRLVLGSLMLERPTATGKFWKGLRGYMVSFRRKEITW